MPAIITRRDLTYVYSWPATDADDPGRSGDGDSARLHRSNGHEVLAFINRFCELHHIGGKPMTRSHALKVERMVRALPARLRSHANVTLWIMANWPDY